MLLRGSVDVLVFDEAGHLRERIRLASDGDAVLYELPPNIYHTVLVQAEETAFFEVKPGPYDPASAAEFADWAPAEGSPEAEGFTARLRTLEVGGAIA